MSAFLVTALLGLPLAGSCCTNKHLPQKYISFQMPKLKNATFWTQTVILKWYNVARQISALLYMSWFMLKHWKKLWYENVKFSGRRAMS